VCLLASTLSGSVLCFEESTSVWRQLLFPVNDNYSSLSATITSLP